METRQKKSGVWTMKETSAHELPIASVSLQSNQFFSRYKMIIWILSRYKIGLRAHELFVPFGE